MLEVQDLAFDYGDKRLLDNICFKVPQGTLLHIKGRNGSGKTTLLKLLAGLLTPHTGTILYQQMEVDSNDYRRHIAYVGHGLGVSRLLSIREISRLEWATAPNEMDTVLSELSLQSIQDVPVHLLSMGLRRRVSLLRAYFSRASLWLLDEPWVALDTETQSWFSQQLTTHLEKGGQIVLTSHQAFPLSALPSVKVYQL